MQQKTQTKQNTNPPSPQKTQTNTTTQNQHTYQKKPYNKPWTTKKELLSSPHYPLCFSSYLSLSKLEKSASQKKPDAYNSYTWLNLHIDSQRDWYLREGWHQSHTLSGTFKIRWSATIELVWNPAAMEKAVWAPLAHYREELSAEKAKVWTEKAKVWTVSFLLRSKAMSYKFCFPLCPHFLSAHILQTTCQLQGLLYQKTGLKQKCILLPCLFWGGQSSLSSSAGSIMQFRDCS